MIAEPDKPWQIYPWNTTLTLIDEIAFNIETFCMEKGFSNLLVP